MYGTRPSAGWPDLGPTALPALLIFLCAAGVGAPEVLQHRISLHGLNAPGLFVQPFSRRESGTWDAVHRFGDNGCCNLQDDGVGTYLPATQRDLGFL